MPSSGMMISLFTNFKPPEEKAWSWFTFQSRFVSLGLYAPIEENTKKRVQILH